MATGWAAVCLAVGAVALVGGLTGVLYWGGGFNEPRGRWVMLICSIGWIFFGAFFVLGALKYRVVLDANSIALVGIFSVKKLRRDEIVAKNYLYQYVRYVILYPHSTHKNKIKISYIYKGNAEIDDWVSNIPDLDKEHHPQSYDWAFRTGERLRRRLKS
jgi:hypothetical protein